MHVLWIEHAGSTLRELLVDQPIETKYGVVRALHGFADGLTTWPPSSTRADIEAGFLATVERAAPAIGAELRQRLEIPPTARAP